MNFSIDSTNSTSLANVGCEGFGCVMILILTALVVGLVVALIIILKRKKREEDEVPDTVPPLEMPKPELPPEILEIINAKRERPVEQQEEQEPNSDFDEFVRQELDKKCCELDFIEKAVESLKEDYIKIKKQRDKMQRYLGSVR